MWQLEKVSRKYSMPTRGTVQETLLDLGTIVAMFFVSTLATGNIRNSGRANMATRNGSHPRGEV